MVSGDGSCLLSGAAAHLRPCGRGLHPLPLLPPGLSCNLNPHFGCHQHYISSTPSRAFWMPLLFIRVKNLPTESGGLAAKLFFMPHVNYPDQPGLCLSPRHKLLESATDPRGGAGMGFIAPHSLFFAGQLSTGHAGRDSPKFLTAFHASNAVWMSPGSF